MTYLDLYELGDQWEGVLDELRDADVDAEELESLQAHSDQFSELCADLNADAPYDPDSLRTFELLDGLIPEREFVDHAQQLAEDIGAVEDFSRWPVSCIDWEQAARELQTDYTSVEYEGTTYFYREG